MTSHLHATASPLHAFGTKVEAELVAPPPPAPPPARSLALWTDVPSFSCPSAIIAAPKGPPGPQDWEPIKTRWVHKGPGVARGTDVCRNWTVPGRRCGDGRGGRCKWCWLTGYIFDTFNELIQTFHTRKDSPVLLLLRFGLCFPFQRRVPAKAVVTQTRRTGGVGAPAHSPAPSLLPSLGRMDLMHILWPPSVHGGILSFTYVVPIKKQIILKSQSFHSASHRTAGARAEGP